MHIEMYNQPKHLPLLLAILAKRGAYLPSEDEMPKVGVVALEGETPVTFCFLRMVEGMSAIVDGLTSNPECSPTLRNLGNDAAIKACIEEAKRLKLKNLIAFTVDASTLERSIRNGFVELQHTCLAYDFNRKVD